MVDIVNAVGGGNLKQKLNLDILHNDIEGNIVRYDPEHWPGLYLRLTHGSPAVLVFTSGKYNIAGADSIAHLEASNLEFLSVIKDTGLEFYETNFEVRNLVILDEYGKELDLDTLSVALGLDLTEYDPDKLPSLLYRPKYVEGTFQLFRTGKILLTGVSDFDKAKNAYKKLFDQLDVLLL